MQKPNNLKALLIDMDGTIADSIPQLFKAYVAFMENFNLLGTKEEFSELIGPSLSTIVKILQKKHHLPKDIKALSGIYHQKLETLYAEPIPIFPDCRECLAYAKKHLQCILVTSATDNLLRSFLKGQKLEKSFDHLISGDLVNKSKPHPEPYLLALKKGHLQPSEAIAIEDSSAGIQSAQAANIPTLWIFENRQKPNHASTLVPVSGWSEVLNLLRGWYE